MISEMLKKVRLRLTVARSGGAVAARSLGATVGDGCRVLSLEMGSEPWLISIGDRVTISSGVQFLTHDGVGWLFNDARGRRFKYARISIGNDVFVGIRSVIMPGVRIGNRCVIGAGSVVTRSVPDGLVVAGNPARVITTYADLMERVKGWTSESELNGLSYRDRIDRAVEPDYLSEVSFPHHSEPNQSS
jgi:acetyltransferase-like isoleucine patch superfamily enzyme